MPSVARRPKPKRIPFTKTKLEKLDAPAEGRRYVYDLKTPGLVVCVSATGGMVFYLYRKIDRRPERIKIGPWPRTTIEAAREEVKRLNGKIAEGENPQEKRRLSRNAPTLGEVFAEYITTPTRGKSKRPRSAKTIADYQWQFEKHLANWRDLRVSKIRRSDVERLHAEIGTASGPYMANRILALVKALLNYAVEQGLIPANLAARIRGFEERSRERYLEAGELPKFWKALDNEPAGDFFKLSLLTGQRQSNVVGARWEQFDLSDPSLATWEIPMTKGGGPLTVPLSPTAVELLTKRRATIVGDWVFPNADGTGPMPIPKHGWERVCKAAAIADLRMHDLRRSLGSWQTVAGSSEAVIGRTLGHKSIAATKIYARAQLQSARQSVNAATDLILAAAVPAVPKRKRSRAK